GIGASDVMIAALRFNGKTVAENGESYRQLLAHDDGARDGDADRMVPELLAFRPHVIIDIGTSAAIVPRLEAAWTGGPGPRWVLGTVDEATWRAVREPTIVRRVLDVESRSDNAVSAKFELRFASVFDPKTVHTRSMTGGPYDAMYALAYAIVALGDAPI